MSVCWALITVVLVSVVSTPWVHIAVRGRWAVERVMSSQTTTNVKVRRHTDLDMNSYVTFFNWTWTLWCYLLTQVHKHASLKSVHVWMNNKCRVMFSDIDECELGSHNCAAGLECQNTIGSFRCRPIVQCGTGFIQDALGNCIGQSTVQKTSHRFKHLQHMRSSRMFFLSKI